MTKKSNLPDKSTATPATVAAWMLKEFEAQDGVLEQDVAVTQIVDLFGDCFVCESDSGSRCISKKVLAAFRKLTGDDVVWSFSDQLWRRREFGDEPTRKQS